MRMCILRSDVTGIFFRLFPPYSAHQQAAVITQTNMLKHQQRQEEDLVTKHTKKQYLCLNGTAVLFYEKGNTLHLICFLGR